MNGIAQNRTFDEMYKKTKELGWKWNHMITYIDIEGSKGNLTVNEIQQ
jgi:hypothetical protein